MRIFFIYPNSSGYGRVPTGPAVIIAILQNEGHDVKLFDTTFIMQSDNSDSKSREKLNLVLQTETSHLYDPHTKKDILDMLTDQVNKFSPDLIMISILEDNYEWANCLLRQVKKSFNNIPVLAGGTTPSVAPEVVIENPNIDFLVQGEGEIAIKEFCGKFEKGNSVENTNNIWYLKNNNVVGNPLNPFIDLNDIPIMNFDIWDKKHFVRPYVGKLYNSGYFELSRGCVFKCTYCVNGTFHKLYSHTNKHYRVKDIGKTLEQIAVAKDKYKFDMITFCDDNFLAMSKPRRECFTDIWKSDINLPYWINTTIESINDEKASFLKETGCCGVGIGIESGSEWLRSNILRKEASNDRYINGFNIIHRNGIRSTANYMIGFPGEYEGDIFESIKLNKKLKPKSYDIGFVTPYCGTLIHKVANELGYIKTQSRPGFNGMVKNISLRGDPLIFSPNIGESQLKELALDFISYVSGAKTIPNKYHKTFPGGNDANSPERERMSREVLDILNRDY
jgi:radical SAM superfamily enzyme YgiQ (UPF0313 family)